MQSINTFSNFNEKYTFSNTLQQNKQPQKTQKSVDCYGKKPFLDALINETKKTADRETKPRKIGFFKAMSSLTYLMPWTALGTYELIKSFRFYKTVKNMSIADKIAKVPALRNKFLKEIALLNGVLLLLSAGVYKYCSATAEQYLKKAQDKVDNYNKKNNANIIFKPDYNSADSSLGGMNPMSGILTVDATMTVDPIMRNTYLPVTVDHELVHAKQYLMIARLDNAMERMNLIIAKRIAKSATPLQKFGINEMKKEIDAGISDKYKTATIDFAGAKINLVDYVNAIYTVMHNPDCKEKDIPTIVNKEFYENAKKMRPLTQDEKQKAEEYLKAYANYPAKINLLPGSDYRNNLLEKEAFEVVPWYFV